MSTNDVPGANPSNGDKLAMGSWAEHKDGSLIFVESTEANNVIYSIFDTGRKPPVEYRDAMPEISFKKTFSWDPAGQKVLNEKWTWHDKTPFPWDRIIKIFPAETKSAAAEHTLNAAEQIIESRQRHSNLSTDVRPETAAERVADALAIEGHELDKSRFEHRMERIFDSVEGILGSLSSALNRLPKSGKNRDKRR